MIEMSRVSRAAISILCSVAVTPALGVMQVDDFEGGSGGGFNNPVFRHEVLASETSQVGPLYEFAASNAVPLDHWLYLYPGTDYITFDLEEGQFVDYAEVWTTLVFSIPLPVPLYNFAFFHVFGVDAFGNAFDVRYDYIGDGGDPQFLSTEGAGFVEITEIRLTVEKTGAFNDVAINVVPEPATLGFLALGLVGFFRHRPRGHRAPRHP